MSVFKKCEICGELAQAICECSPPGRFFCDLHTSDHRRSGGAHPFSDAFIPLSSQETSFIRQVSDQCKIESIRKAVLRRDKRIEDLFRQIKEVEEDCAREIKNIVKERSIVEEACAYGGIPLYSDSPLPSSLISLQKCTSFSYQSILRQIFSVNLSLPPLPSSIPPLASSLHTRSPPQWELFQELEAHRKSIESVAISDCERYLASGSDDRTIKIWDLESLECIYTLRGHSKYVKAVTFWRNKLISGSSDKTIKIWEGDQCTDTISLHSNSVYSVCISSCKRLLASGSRDGSIVVYNLEEKRIIHSLLSHRHCVNSVVFTHSDRQIVSGSEDTTIKVWDTDTGELLKTLNGHSEGITSVCLSGSFVVSSSLDNTIKIWDIGKGKAVKTLNGHSAKVVKVEGNEHILASFGHDSSIKIWNSRSGRCIQTLERHGDYRQANGWWNTGLKFVREGDYLIWGASGKNLKIFKRVN